MIDDWTSVFSKVKAALRRRGRSEHDAEDLVQEAFVRLATYEQERAVDKPEAFLMKTALHLSIDAYRSRASHGEEVLLDDVVIMDTAPGTEDVHLSRERLQRLSACVARMNDKTRSIFLAHRLEGLSYQEIGRLHGLSVSGVEKHVAKAVLIITRWMEGWYP